MTKRILLVDDSKTARMFLKGPLKKAGFEVIEAGSGTEGLNLIQNSQNPIDLIISDFNMPEMNGAEMMRQVRGMSGSTNENSAVMFLTSDTSPAIKELCKEVSAKSIIMKPVQPVAVVKIIRKFFEDIEDEDDESVSTSSVS